MLQLILLFSLEPCLQAFVAFDPENGEASVLEGFRQSEKDDEEHSFGFGTDRQQELCSREDVERDAQYKYSNPRPE